MNTTKLLHIIIFGGLIALMLFFGFRGGGGQEPGYGYDAPQICSQAGSGNC